MQGTSFSCRSHKVESLHPVVRNMATAAYHCLTTDEGYPHHPHRKWQLRVNVPQAREKLLHFPYTVYSQFLLICYYVLLHTVREGLGLLPRKTPRITSFLCSTECFLTLHVYAASVTWISHYAEVYYGY